MLPNDPPGDGGGSSDQDKNLMQRIAFTFGVDPFKLSQQQIALYRNLLGIQDQVKANYPDYEADDGRHYVNPNTGHVIEFVTGPDGRPKVNEYTQGESRAYLGSASGTGSGGGGSGADLRPREFDDPRYWDLQYQKLQNDATALENQLINSGMDADSARRQALATLITNRNAQQVNLADVQAQTAAKAAEFAANPRDAVAELMFRNAAQGEGQGATPFGAAQSSPSFPQYQTALQQKFQDLFGGTADSLKRAQEFLLSPPPLEFLGPETRSELGKPAFPPRQFAYGGEITAQNGPPRPDFGVGGAPVTPRDQPGYSPTSSEGGLNLNLHERAFVVGESGHIYATLGEKRPDGSIRSENLIVKPLKSEVEKDKKLQEQGKRFIESQKQTIENLPQLAQGGAVRATPDPSDFINQLRQQLRNLGSPGAGTGDFRTALPDIRLLAGAPAEMLADDPVLADYAASGYSSLGIDPRTVAATIQKFGPTPVRNNIPRISWI